MADSLFEYYNNGFLSTLSMRTAAERRIGSELKFPLVTPNGSVASREQLELLWQFLHQNGWEPEYDAAGAHLIGARIAGPQNDSIASCETGYCKTEFSLAHVDSVNELDNMVSQLRKTLQRFMAQHDDTRLIGYAIQPVTPPHSDLLMSKSRSGVFDQLFVSNEKVPPENGHDLHLFTINACSHVHVSITPDEAVKAVNVLNGFAPAQLFLLGNSSVWKNTVDPEFNCVNEMFWNWWIDDAERIGIPSHPFESLEDYVATISDLKPVYVRRNGTPFRIDHYKNFSDYFYDTDAHGFALDGDRHSLSPSFDDFDRHNTCYWYNARLTRYFTVENRANDQQNPDELCAIAALTLGLIAALDIAHEEIQSMDWQKLSAARIEACRRSRDEKWEQFLTQCATRMLDIAESGLRSREAGEEEFLTPLHRRLKEKTSPGKEAAELFTSVSPTEFINRYTL